MTAPLVILTDPVRKHIVNSIQVFGKEGAKRVEKLREAYREENGNAPDRVILDGEKTYVLGPDQDLPAGGKH